MITHRLVIPFLYFFFFPCPFCLCLSLGIFPSLFSIPMYVCVYFTAILISHLILSDWRADELSFFLAFFPFPRFYHDLPTYLPTYLLLYSTLPAALLTPPSLTVCLCLSLSMPFSLCLLVCLCLSLSVSMPIFISQNRGIRNKVSELSELNWIELRWLSKSCHFLSVHTIIKESLNLRSKIKSIALY